MSKICIRCGMFHCGECGFDRPADFVAALNMMRAAGVPMSVWEKRFAALDDLAAAVKEARA